MCSRDKPATQQRMRRQARPGVTAAVEVPTRTAALIAGVAGERIKIVSELKMSSRARGEPTAQ